MRSAAVHQGSVKFCRGHGQVGRRRTSFPENSLQLGGSGGLGMAYAMAPGRHHFRKE